MSTIDRQKSLQCRLFLFVGNVVLCRNSAYSVLITIIKKVSMNLNINSKSDLIDLLEDSVLVNESPSKREVRCESLIRRDGKLYIIEYLQSYEDGVQWDTAEVYEVTERQVITTVYDRVTPRLSHKAHSKSPTK